MENKEIRSNSIELRVAEDNDRLIRGTAIVFNSPSELISEKGIRFKEIIKPEAITRELIEKSDITMLYNHKKDMGVLARSKYGKGSLQIDVDDNGVNFEFRAKNTNLGNEVFESVRQGDLDGCSFAFYVTRDGEEWAKEGDVRIRYINKIELLDDFSIVTTPAYSATNVSARSLDEIVEMEQQEELRIAEEKRIEDERLETERLNNLENYYLELEKRISNI